MPRAGFGTAAGVWGVTAALLGLAALAPARPDPAAAKAADPHREPLALAAKAKAAFAQVKCYSCKLIKRERLEGELSPNHVIDLKVRQTPFSVSMVWQEPKDLEGQEVVYAEDRHDGKMRVKPGGLLGSVGFLTLAPNDPRARRTSRHKITEAGIGHLIDRCLQGWEVERKLKQTSVKVGTYSYAKRRCTRVELTHRSRAGGKLKYSRNVLYFDQQTHLPIRVENYGWPEEDGQPGPLLETFSYVNLKLNPELPAETFER